MKRKKYGKNDTTTIIIMKRKIILILHNNVYNHNSIRVLINKL